jgi:hypothetical protein
MADSTDTATASIDTRPLLEGIRERYPRAYFEVTIATSVVVSLHLPGLMVVTAAAIPTEPGLCPFQQAACAAAEAWATFEKGAGRDG